MGSTATEISERIRSGIQQAVDGLRSAASAVEDDSLGIYGMTVVLKEALSDRNRLEAALTGAIGALDRVAERVPDGQLTAGLSCATWLSHHCQMSSSAAHAQVRLARQLPFLPDTARAFEQGLISPQHASVVARSVELVARGEGDQGEAEARLLEEARVRDPRALFRWGLSLVHELAPSEMAAEEDQR